MILSCSNFRLRCRGADAWLITSYCKFYSTHLSLFFRFSYKCFVRNTICVSSQIMIIIATWWLHDSPSLKKIQTTNKNLRMRHVIRVTVRLFNLHLVYSSYNASVKVSRLHISVYVILKIKIPNYCDSYSIDSTPTFLYFDLDLYSIRSTLRLLRYYIQPSCSGSKTGLLMIFNPT